MKIRFGFVSNSSSSSFVVDREFLSNEQVDMIINHIQLSQRSKISKDDIEYPVTEYDAWDIQVRTGYIRGTTLMDNFDMRYFLANVVGISEDKIDWG